jgi:histidyl-tRNA synthetase
LQISTPRGVRDFSPSEAISLRYIAGVVEEVFKRFGFYPIETPAIENLSVLNAKAYGDESTKEIYKIDGEDAGLRYDFTVPLARYVASNKDIPLPFKRYQTGAIWRRDEPQRMRYREFLQADLDIVGSSEPESDAEVIAAPAIAIEELGISDYTLLLNSRSILRGILEFFKVPADKQVPVVRAIDKLQKLGREATSQQLAALGLVAESCDGLLGFLETKGDNEEKLEKLCASVASAKPEAERMKDLLKMLGAYGLRGKVVVDFSLARGIDYYTGFVWEFVVEENGKRLPSFCSGGRYDGLIGLYSDRSVPATGSSIGISRVFDIIGGSSPTRTLAKVFIAYVGENRDYAMSVARSLRGEGVYTDINCVRRSLSKQLEHASSLKVRYVAILGDAERSANKLKLRDMLSGEEEMLGVDEAAEKLKM